MLETTRQIQLHQDFLVGIFQPIWKMLVKVDHFPKQGWKSNIFETTTYPSEV